MRRHTAPDIVRLDAVAEFFGRTQADLVGVEVPVESSHDLGGLSSLADDSKPTASTLPS